MMNQLSKKRDKGKVMQLDEHHMKMLQIPDNAFKPEYYMPEGMSPGVVTDMENYDLLSNQSGEIF